MLSSNGMRYKRHIAGFEVKVRHRKMDLTSDRIRPFVCVFERIYSKQNIDH